MRQSFEKSDLRLAFIAELVSQAPLPLGRTGIMKLVYFLQTLRQVPLAYNFRIYTYGPYDGQVLEDLKVAESVKAVETETFRFPGGVGFHIKKGGSIELLLKRASEIINKYSEDTQWVISHFAEKPAVDLEIESTVIFVDRSKEIGNYFNLDQIVKDVHLLKPHHTIERIRRGASKLHDLGLLMSVQ